MQTEAEANGTGADAPRLPQRRSVRISASISPATAEAILEMAVRAGLTRSAVVAALLAGAVGRRAQE